MKKEICLLLLPLLLISGCGFGTDDTKSPQEGQIITRKTVQDAAKKDKAPEKTETPATPQQSAVPQPQPASQGNAAAATGQRTRLYHMIIALLPAVTIVLGMRMMGALLISSLIIFPSLTAMQLCSRFKTTVLLSAVLSVLSFMAGITISYVGSVPTGACIVVCDIFLLAGAVLLRKWKEGF